MNFKNGKTAGTARRGTQTGFSWQKKVFFLWFSGVAPVDIAKKCQITEDMVSQILDEVSQMY